MHLPAPLGGLCSAAVSPVASWNLTPSKAFDDTVEVTCNDIEANWPSITLSSTGGPSEILRGRSASATPRSIGAFTTEEDKGLQRALGGRHKEGSQLGAGEGTRCR